MTDCRNELDHHHMMQISTDPIDLIPTNLEVSSLTPPGVQSAGVGDRSTNAAHSEELILLLKL